MKDNHMCELASKLQGHARAMEDSPLKRLLHEASHCLDTRNTWIENGKQVKNARGASRKLTLLEKIAYKLFSSVPKDAVATQRQRRKNTNG